MGALSAFFLWYAAWTDGGAPFPDIPANHWAYEGLAEAKRDGLMVGYSDGLVYREPPKSRYTMLLPILHAMARCHGLTRDLVAGRDSAVSPAQIAAYNEEYGIASGYRRHLVFFRRAEAEFWPQIAALRKFDPEGEYVSVAQVERATNRVLALGPATAGERTRPFPGVRKDHWAATAISDLRAWGLIDGYPGQRFGSPRP